MGKRAGDLLTKQRHVQYECEHEWVSFHKPLIAWWPVQCTPPGPAWFGVGLSSLQPCQGGWAGTWCKNGAMWTSPRKKRQISQEACTFLFIHLYQLFLLFDRIIHLLPFSSHSPPCSSSSSFTSLKQLDIGFWNVSVLYWFLLSLQSSSDGLNSCLCVCVFMRFCHRTLSISSLLCSLFIHAFSAVHC